MRAGPGHNGGPALGPGLGWQRHCWTKARADLLPHLPLEVLRGRVRRAQDLGLDYKTYASVRAATGHDVLAFLFSSNALRVFAPAPEVPQDRALKLASVQAGRIGLAQGRLQVADLAAAAGGLLEAAHPAPQPLATFSAARDRLRAALGPLPGDRVILVGDMEREWCAAGRLAAYLPAERFFCAG
ncbi:hypothetical protein RNZ50_09925 [Paracoccaceae bacterium Fryx2]|nr:hypothetical protein [Paracoccaceae bacterium Fryx2]